ncbi:methylenetetrahydrofolate reductase [Leuconostoc mesenteroides]|uniref:methylenetetrahydrofolate reductase n=1 Tax=Leuconostoc mesenteroides TaxID=1245 RepID=UPI00385ADE91
MTRITDIYKKKSAPVLSFEIFPPKTEDGLHALYKTLQEVNPKETGVDYISVTYGAGGGSNHKRTKEIAEYIEKNCGITALHNLTGINQTPSSLKGNLEKISVAGVENIFALRGDTPTKDGADVKIMDRFFRHRELPDSENFSKPGFQLKTA